ncbi:leucine-rich repeat domain, L domain-like protein [Artemisia annua]|uniref:Leucine-rich repeat domain, L domain-like protein n=1 Tax=Artemisia annua TaxID=35608 RepID=A0A2U1Q010_ARTAN|nr:leucine-rich repeat domain, L domain-like protein [Artemisia annua]
MLTARQKVLNNLRFLDLSYSKLRTFDLRLAPNLEQLTITSCHDFVELHMPADHHSKLKYLNLSHSKLKSLHLGNTPNLENLKLKGCNHLVELQMPVKSLKLKYLDLTAGMWKFKVSKEDYYRNMVQELCGD